MGPFDRSSASPKFDQVCAYSCAQLEDEERGLSLAAVRDLRDVRTPAGPEELVDFETDVLAGFVLARRTQQGRHAQP